MNRILALVAGLALAGAAFAGEPVKTDTTAPAKTEAAAPAKADSAAKTDAKPTDTKEGKDTKKNTKNQPKGRKGQVKDVPAAQP